MSKNEMEKFPVEAQSLLVNIKITLKEILKNPGSGSGKEAYREILNKFGEVSGIYGINSVLSLTNKLLELINPYLQEDIKINKDCLEMLEESESMLEGLIGDPLLKNKELKNAYDTLLQKADKLLNKSQKDNKSDSAKMPADKFQEVFIEEAFDLINQLEEKMLQLESDMNDEHMVDQVFRIMHTLKGNSNMFGYTHLGELTHELENIYDHIRDKKISLSRRILEITLNCIDHFRDLIEDPELTNPSVREYQKEILGAIKDLLFGGDKESEPDADRKVSPGSKVLHTFYLFFNPGPDVFDNGSNPLYFIYDLHDLGQCLAVPVFREECRKPDYNPHKCYTIWHVLLATESTEEDIREHFLFLQEESQPYVQILTEGNFIRNKKFMQYFQDVSGNNTMRLKIDPDVFIEEGKEHRVGRADASSKASKESISSVRVSSQKIDQMMNLISELVTKQAELTMLVANQPDQRLIEVAESIENISRDLRDNAFSISLIPLEKSVLRFQRLVRDVSNRFEKKVEFIVEGKETELDKTIIEKIVDPIMHILRNSIDHGIELPEERRKKGKPETGTIRLKAYPSGAHVVIEISDDGAGINLVKVKSTAVSKGMIGTTDQINNDELLNLIVSPGFSTAENISEVSGRGVGMDVVNQKISEIRGELEIRTEQDKGTTITIRLPLTAFEEGCELVERFLLLEVNFSWFRWELWIAVPK